MIYTVTFNPSLDYVVTVDHFQCGMVNRTNNEMILPGGKGVNVSMVLKNLGHETTALGFVAGFTGAELQRLLKEKGIVEHGELVVATAGVVKSPTCGFGVHHTNMMRVVEVE